MATAHDPQRTACPPEWRKIFRALRQTFRVPSEHDPGDPGEAEDPK